MRIARVPAVRAGLMNRADTVRQSSRDRISAFSKNKLIEHQLVPRTSTFTPYIGENSPSDSRKTFVRLKTMFTRALEKQIPYVEYAETPVLEIQDREFFTITLSSVPEMYEGSWGNFNLMNSLQHHNYCIASRFAAPLHRYLHHLQYLCLKNAIPLSISPEYTVRLTPRQVDRVQKMTAQETANLQKVEVQCVVTVRISFVRWYNNLHRDLMRRGAGSQQSFEEFLAQQIEENGESRTFFPPGWSTSSFTRTREDAPTAALYARYRIPETVFFYVPQIQKVLRTLTRKTHYVPSAFSIGTVEAA